VPGAQLAARLFQFLGGLPAGPISFDCALQFTLGADAGEPQIMNRSHGSPPLDKICSSDSHFEAKSK
jgi:hypothetical protein